MKILEGNYPFVLSILVTLGLGWLIYVATGSSSRPTYANITALAQSEDGKRLAVGLTAHTGALFGFTSNGRASNLDYVRIIDIEDLRIVPRPLTHNNNRVIWSAAFTPDASTLVSASEDAGDSVKFWNADSGEALASYSLSPDQGCGVAVSPDGLRVAVVPCEGTAVEILDAKTHRSQAKLPVDGRFSYDFAVTFLADSRHVVVSQKHRGAVMLDIDDTADVFRIECNDNLHGTEYVISPNRKYLAISCMAPEVNATQLWSLEERRLLADLPIRFSIALGDTSIALGSSDDIDIYSVPAAQLLHTVPSYGPGMTFLGIAVSPDQRLLATVGGLENKLRMWSLRNEGLLWEYDQSDPAFGRVIFNKAGTRVVATLGRSILPTQVNARPYLKVFDAQTGRNIFSVTHDPAEEIAASH